MDKKQNKPTPEQNKAMPETFKIIGNWKTLSKRLNAKFAQLTESDLKFETGKEEDLIKRIETRLHKKREEVIQLLNAAQLVKPRVM
ncbi:MAG TPA: hypothetical protein VIU12_14885 [Chryseolinea sp.]